jgi:hypothetical protein
MRLQRCPTRRFSFCVSTSLVLYECSQNYFNSHKCHKKQAALAAFSIKQYARAPLLYVYNIFEQRVAIKRRARRDE